MLQLYQEFVVPKVTLDCRSLGYIKYSSSSGRSKNVIVQLSSLRNYKRLSIV